MSVHAWHLVGVVVPYVVIATALWGLASGAAKDAVQAGSLPERMRLGFLDLPTVPLAYVLGFGAVAFIYGCALDRNHLGIVLGTGPHALAPGADAVLYGLAISSWTSAGLLAGFYRRIRYKTKAIIAAPAERDEVMERYRILVEHISDLVSHHDLEGRYEWMSESTRDMLGYEPRELLGTDPHDLIHSDDVERVRAEGFDLLRGGDVQTAVTRYRIQRKDDQFVWFESLMEPIRDACGEITRFQVTSRDITERQAFEDELHRRAHHDPLTGLANRVLFTLRLDTTVEFARYGMDEGDVGYAVLYLDLDRFKAVNDTLGHAAGDEVLVEVGRRLQASTRAFDTVARIGGDEFAVLIEHTNVEAAAVRAATRIEEALREPFLLGGHTRSLSASIGIAIGRTDHENAGSVLREADLAAYQAKDDGRDGWALFSPALRAASERRRRIESDLEGAIRNGELVVAYQPIVHLKTGVLHGVEALVRWNHPELGLISPEAFIDIAEETGHITDLDHWVMSEALNQHRRWEHEVGYALDLKMSVNCSVRDIHDPQFAWSVRSLLAASGIGRGQLTIEVTESLLVDDPQRVATVLQSLRDQDGVEFSMDDFGTGYSSLSVVHALPVDKVKVDQAFVRRMHDDSAALAMVKTVVGFAHTMGTVVVAEGIETPRQLVDLRALGCEYGQGFLLSKPLRPEEMSRCLRFGGPWRRHWDGLAETASKLPSIVGFEDETLA